MVVRGYEVENGKGEKVELEIYINGKSVKQIEKELKGINPKYNFYNCLPLMSGGEMTIALIYLGGFVHKKGSKNSVGSDWFDDNDVSIFEHMESLFECVGHCLEDIKPTNKGK